MLSKMLRVGKKSVITLERIGLMPMPLEILVTYKDGNEEFIIFLYSNER